MSLHYLHFSVVSPHVRQSIVMLINAVDIQRHIDMKYKRRRVLVNDLRGEHDII